MSCYADTSVVLAAVLSESHSEPARALLASDEQLVASEWLIAEIASALGIKGRRGELSRDQVATAQTLCRTVLSTGAIMLAVTSDDCRTATRFVEQTSLRAPDALHLAIASKHDCRLWTLDTRMAEAGQALGLGTQLLR